jgi:8-oxo-dGTP pyrophosphatase MutT (NUDIX family)
MSSTIYNKKIMEISCGIVIFHEPSNSVLMGRATRSGSEWSIPKGKKEDEENDYQTALRELKEETNVDSEYIKKCKVYKLDAYPYKSRRKILKPYLAISTKKCKDLKCNSFFDTEEGESLPEFDKIEWVDFDSILKGMLNIHDTQMKMFLEVKKIVDSLEL